MQKWRNNLYDIENASRRVSREKGGDFKEAKQHAVETAKRRVECVTKMTEPQFMSLRAGGFMGETEADDTAFAIDGYYLPTASKPDLNFFEAAKAEVLDALNMDVTLTEQLTEEQFRETKFFFRMCDLPCNV